MHSAHRILLKEIRSRAGKPTPNPFLDNYLGNTHPKYNIHTPALRGIARDWLSDNRDLTPADVARVITSLVAGKSCTEKLLGGLLLNATPKEQRSVAPAYFSRWLNHLVGWVEVDTLCTGRYSETEVPRQWSAWKKQLNAFAKSNNIQKRRASLVLLCSPLRKANDPRLLDQALRTVAALAQEKDVRITKAISWVLRSAGVYFPAAVKKYVTLNKSLLPRIAVRETMIKLSTGLKTKRKKI